MNSSISPFLSDDPNFPGITYRRGASGWVTLILRGTRIRVQTVVLDPVQISSDHEMEVGRIHEAMAFYKAHRQEIDSNIKAEQ